MITLRNALLCSALLAGASGCAGKNSTPPPSPLPAWHSGTVLGATHNAAPLGISRVQVTASPVPRTFVTDPDHDSVWIVPSNGDPTQQIELGVGEEPGDIQFATTDSDKTTAYVSIHNGGALLAIPLTASTAEPLAYSRIPVCQSPRGMDAYGMPTGETLFVACADGVLVSVDVATNTVLSTLPLADDLKDVVVMDGIDALVTRFRSAQVLVVNLKSGTFSATSLPSFAGILEEGFGPEGSEQSNGPPSPMVADVAWQMLPIGGFPRTGALIAHQLASTSVISVESTAVSPPANEGDSVDAGTPEGPAPQSCSVDNGGCDPNATCSETPDGTVCTCNPGFGGNGTTCFSGDSDGGIDAGMFVMDVDGGFTGIVDPPACTSGQAGYGPSGCGGSFCGSGVVAAAATVVLLPVDDQAPVMMPLAVLNPMIPPLIAAIAPTGLQQGSLSENDAIALIGGLGNGGVAMVDLTEALATTGPSTQPPIQSTFSCGSATSSLPSGVTAFEVQAGEATFAALFRQTGSTAASVAQLALTPFDTQTDDSISTQGGQFVVKSSRVLPYQSMQGEDGRNIFHEATPSMMSCASCHPTGRDDGHTWNFNPMGLRRTPSLGGGLLATAPFHWDGSEVDISHLMNDVFVGRMEGPPPTAAQVTAIGSWLDGLPEAHAAAAPDAAAVSRGQTLFESTSVGCIACHNGQHFTDNLTVDVGTGGAFQVPSLRGVGSRPPYLHDGRAATLEDRFNPALGGGDQHGHTSQLSTSQIEDLVAYLQSL